MLSNPEVLNDLQDVPYRFDFDTEILVNMAGFEIVVLIVVRSERAEVRFK